MKLHTRWALWAVVLLVISLVAACGPSEPALGGEGDPTVESPSTSVPEQEDPAAEIPATEDPSESEPEGEGLTDVSPLEPESEDMEDLTGVSPLEPEPEEAEGSAATGASGPVGTSWNLVEMNGEPVPEEGEATLDFDEGQANGKSFCNSFFADYELEGETLSFGPIGATLMACADMEPENAYFAALAEVVAYEMVGEALHLQNENGEVVLAYEPSVQAELEETTWKLSGILEHGGISSLILDTEVTATLSDGVFGGSAGCNSYTAEATVEGNSIEIAPAIRTEMFCMEPKGVMDQEDAYLYALTQVASYEINRNRLTFFDAEGVQILTFVAASS